MRSGRFSRKGEKDAWDLEEWIILFSSLAVRPSLIHAIHTAPQYPLKVDIIATKPIPTTDKTGSVLYIRGQKYCVFPTHPESFRALLEYKLEMHAWNVTQKCTGHAGMTALKKKLKFLQGGIIWLFFCGIVVSIHSFSRSKRL